MTLDEQYSLYLAAQERRAVPAPQAHLDPRRALEQKLHARTRIRVDGLPILNRNEFGALMVEDEAPEPYRRQPEPGIPESEAIEGTVKIGKVLADVIRSVMDRPVKAPINTMYRAKIEAGRSRPLSERLAWCVTEWDLRPEWIEEILAHPGQQLFVFGRLPADTQK